MKVAGVVLAGGLSRRMEGREKSLIKLAEKPLVTRVCERLEQQVSNLVVNANGEPERFGFVGHPVVADPVEGFVGPLAGVLAGLQWSANLNEDISHVVSIAADTPFFPTDLVARFQSSLKGKPTETIALASTNGRSHPVFGLWPVMLAKPLEDFLIAAETRKVLAFVDQHGLVDVPFDDSDQSYDPFFNINTPEDLGTAEALIAESTA